VGHRGAQALLWSCLAASVGVPAASSQPASLGRITFQTSGAAAAWPAFIRGVLLLHSFEYDDAIEAFREAERIDPRFAMAYWGEAMCFNQPLWGNENLDKARDAVARLDTARRARPVTARERLYVAAVEQLFGPGDKASRDRAYAAKMDELMRAFPEDQEAAAFNALALLTTNPLKAGAIASDLLAKNPRHPGAAHYVLHAYGNVEHAAKGLAAARTYAGIAPASSHARHMPSHVFVPLGLWDEAVASDESAFAASVAWVRRHHASEAQQDFHSLSWLHYEYLQQGRFAKASGLHQIVERAAALPAAGDAHGHVESEIGRGFAPIALKSELASLRARLIVESGRWSDMRGRATFDNVDELFALGLASARLGDSARARAALDHMVRAIDAAPDPDNRQLADIMRLELRGVLQEQSGDRAGALETLAAAARLEAKRPPPNGRPHPIKPAVELYAEALLDAGRPREAAAQFQASLARTPRRAASLIGLARSQDAAGQHTEARRTAREFLEMWPLADGDRPETARARAILTRR
jgi:tetratricopeptide (TPR) repeat protein